MEINVLEQKKDKLKIEVIGEDHTLLNLLRENSWKVGCDQASYMIKHPYLAKPKITVKSKNPKKTLKDSSQTIIDDATEFLQHFKRAAKKK